MENSKEKEVIRAAVNLITDAISDVLYVDPHSWSERDCQTCRVISSLLGKPFGCYRFAAEKRKKKFGE